MPIKKRVWGPANRKGKTWVLDYYDQVGKLRHKAFKNRRDAERFSEKTHVRIGQLTAVVVAMNMGKDKRSRIRIRISDITTSSPMKATRRPDPGRVGLTLTTRRPDPATRRPDADDASACWGQDKCN